MGRDVRRLRETGKRARPHITARVSRRGQHRLPYPLPCLHLYPRQLQQNSPTTAVRVYSARAPGGCTVCRGHTQQRGLGHDGMRGDAYGAPAPAPLPCAYAHPSSIEPNNAFCPIRLIDVSFVLRFNHVMRNVLGETLGAQQLQVRAAN